MLLVRLSSLTPEQISEWFSSEKGEAMARRIAPTEHGVAECWRSRAIDQFATYCANVFDDRLSRNMSATHAFRSSALVSRPVSILVNLGRATTARRLIRRCRRACTCMTAITR
jgi:hypothetical protein